MLSLDIDLDGQPATHCAVIVAGQKIRGSTLQLVQPLLLSIAKSTGYNFTQNNESSKLFGKSFAFLFEIPFILSFFSLSLSYHFLN